MSSLGLTDEQLLKNCESVCPLLAAPDLKTTCDVHHSFHPHVQAFRDASEYRGNMQWTIFFICLSACELPQNESHVVIDERRATAARGKTPSLWIPCCSR